MVKVSQVYVGVDISKNNLDIYIYPIAKFFRVDNSKEGIKQLVLKLTKYNVAQVACEATGGYEKLLIKTLQQHLYNSWIIDPRRIKGFITSKGFKSKSDKIDAQKIAEFVAQNSNSYQAVLKTETEENLKALVNRKQDLTTFLGAEKVRLQHPSHELSVSSIKKMISFLQKEIKKIDKNIEDIIKSDADLCLKSDYLASIPGIGKATASLLLSFVPELGTINNKQVSALVGLCPYTRESGNYKGKRFIQAGRVVPRNALYMCALTTIKYHLPLKDFYNRLIDNGKPFKVAIVAIMRKLIVIANSILKKGEPCKV